MFEFSFATDMIMNFWMRIALLYLMASFMSIPIILIIDIVRLYRRYKTKPTVLCNKCHNDDMVRNIDVDSITILMIDGSVLVESEVNNPPSTSRFQYPIGTFWLNKKSGKSYRLEGEGVIRNWKDKSVIGGKKHS